MFPLQAVKRFGTPAMIEAVEHIYKDGKGVLIRPVSEIIYGLKNAGREFE